MGVTALCKQAPSGFPFQVLACLSFQPLIVVISKEDTIEKSVFAGCGLFTTNVFLKKTFSDTKIKTTKKSKLIPNAGCNNFCIFI